MCLSIEPSTDTASTVCLRVGCLVQVASHPIQPFQFWSLWSKNFRRKIEPRLFNVFLLSSPHRSATLTYDSVEESTSAGQPSFSFRLLCLSIYLSLRLVPCHPSSSISLASAVICSCGHFSSLFYHGYAI